MRIETDSPVTDSLQHIHQRIQQDVRPEQEILLLIHRVRVDRGQNVARHRGRADRGQDVHPAADQIRMEVLLIRENVRIRTDPILHHREITEQKE